jgi:predicted esterase
MKSEPKPVVERSLTARVDLYYDLQPGPETRAPLLIGLHGYGAHKAQILREAQRMVPDGFAIASLQGFHQHLKDPREPGGPLRFGFGWLTNYRTEESIAIHHRALLDLIGTLVAEDIADPSRIFLLGFSQSCALNYRFAFTHANVLRGIIGICGGIPGDWTTNNSYKHTAAAVFHLAGNSDSFYPPERVRSYQEQLSTRADRVQFKTYEAGHDFTEPMRQDIRLWLREEVAR